MKNIVSAFTLTLLCLVFFSILYPMAITGIAQFAPNKGKGETTEVNGKIVGFAKVGQSFTRENYFWGRPSAVGYNAAGSGGSNKGPSNPDYLKDVQTRIDSFLVHHHYLSKKDVTTEMVTASGSGLDPHISPHTAMLQIKRIAKARRMSEQKLVTLVKSNTEYPLSGLWGTSTVNVLILNVALDRLSPVDYQPSK